MRKYLWFGGLALLLSAVALGAYLMSAFRLPEPLESDTTAFALSGVTVIHPGESRRADATVAVSGGSFVEDASGLEVLDEFAGCFVVPGLVDMHTHMPPDNALKLGDYFLLLHLAHGVTTIRDAGDTEGTALPRITSELESGALPGPRVFSAGYFVAAEESRWSNTLMVSEAADAEAVVQRIADEGHSFIKAYEGLTTEMIAAIVSAAESRGMGVLGHVPFDLTLEEAMLPDVQHLLGVVRPENISADTIMARMSEWETVDDARMDKVVAFCVENDIVNTPTLVVNQRVLSYRHYESIADDPAVRLLPPFFPGVVWSPTEGIPMYRGIGEADLQKMEAALAKKKVMVRKLHEAGARLQLGTDTQQPFVVPGAALHTEMRAFADAGVPPASILRYATTGSYTALPAAELGRVEPRYLADAVVFRDDPTESLDALDAIVAVISRGRLYRKSEIDAKIGEYQAFYRSFPVNSISQWLARRALASAVADNPDSASHGA